MGTTPHRLERAFRCSGKAQALWLRETSEGHFLTFLSVEAAGLQCPSFEKPLQEGHYLLRWDASWKLLWSLPLNAVRINGFSLKETLVLDSQGEVWAVVWEEETFVFSLQRISKHGEIRSRIPLEFPKGEAPTALASFPGKGIALVGWVGAYRRNVRIGHLSLPEQSEPRLFLALFPVP